RSAGTAWTSAVGTRGASPRWDFRVHIRSRAVLVDDVCAKELVFALQGRNLTPSLGQLLHQTGERGPELGHTLAVADLRCAIRRRQRAAGPTLWVLDCHLGSL